MNHAKAFCGLARASLHGDFQRVLGVGVDVGAVAQKLLDDAFAVRLVDGDEGAVEGCQLASKSV